MLKLKFFFSLVFTWKLELFEENDYCALREEKITDIQLRLFSERLRRLLSGEEVTLPDAAKQLVQNLHTEIETVTFSLRDYECDIAGLLVNIIVDEDETYSPDLQAIMEEINCFAYESEKVVDTFIISIAQQKGQSSSKEMCDALVELQSKIIDIGQRLQQVQHMDTSIVEQIKFVQADTGNSSVSSMSKERDTVGLDDRMEESLVLVIEGPPQLSLVAVLDSIGLDETAFAAEAYNSSLWIIILIVMLGFRSRFPISLTTY